MDPDASLRDCQAFSKGTCAGSGGLELVDLDGIVAALVSAVETEGSQRVVEVPARRTLARERARRLQEACGI